MRTASRSAKAALVVAGIPLLVATVSASDLRVMTSGAFAAPYLALSPQFERATTNKMVTVTTTIGVGADSITSRIQRGEAVDVVILPDTALAGLIREGLVIAGSRVALARSGIGMAVRAGAPKPDISSVDGLKTTLLRARSIAYSASVSGDYLSTELFHRLGIAERVKGKSQRIERERVGAVVARGEAEIGFQQISELLPVPGIDYVGPLPPEVQRITVISAGVAAAAGNPDAARAFIAFLASAGTRDVIRKSGLEPVTPD
jgi:molybdate transport system substrate-binding protein